MYDYFSETSLRASPLLCLNPTSPRSHELRRRLAIAFFFDDLGLGIKHPDDSLTLSAVIEHVKEEAKFRVNQNTDYVQLTALMQLINMVVDDGARSPTDDDETFNQQVDELARLLRNIWGMVNDAGVSFVSRTEAKSVIEWVQERLVYTVRTRPLPKKSIFDSPQKKDRSLPEQQAYMRDFIRKKKAASTLDRY
jgi:hypothetical protein